MTDTSEPTYSLRISEEFVDGLARIDSERVLDQIRHLLSLLETTPEIGSANVHSSLVERYGPRLRKLPVSTFVIIYRIVDTTVDVLALVHGPMIT